MVWQVLWGSIPISPCTITRCTITRIPGIIYVRRIDVALIIRTYTAVVSSIDRGTLRQRLGRQVHIKNFSAFSHRKKAISSCRRELIPRVWFHLLPLWYDIWYDIRQTPPQHTSTWQVATVRQNRKGWASSVLHLTPCTRVMSCHGNHGRRGVGARFSNFKSLARGHYKVDAARQLRWRPTGGRSPTWRIRFAHYGTYPESLVENAFQQTTTKLIPSDVQLFYTRYLQKQKI